MNIDINKKEFSCEETSFPDAETRGTVEFQVLCVVQALRLIFARSSSDNEYGAWGFLKSAYHDEDGGILYLRYSFGPQVAYSTELPVLDDPRPGEEVWLQLVSRGLRTRPDPGLPERARFAMVRDFAHELAITACLDTPALFDTMQSAAEMWSTLASQLYQDLMPQCRMYDMGPWPSVYLDTRIHRKPSTDMLLQSSTQNSKSH
ncbi:hypothetical protein BDZ89DRAFT_1154808 [Hymenopellis radicata]|nr:hypothetical protein BDZ89DRAFT_1154808 [Hymenopellis radicata]